MNAIDEMHFVVIDLQQLYTRLWNSSMQRQALAMEEWLADHGFTPTDGGWLATADGIECLSCTEILVNQRAGEFIGMDSRRNMRPSDFPVMSKTWLA